MYDLSLLTLIHQKKWSDIPKRIKSHPREVSDKLDTDSWLPIHDACLQIGVPGEVIEALIKASPQTVKQKMNILEALPIHAAVRHASATMPDVVKVLLRYYKEGATTGNSNGHTPLVSHLVFCKPPSLKVVKALVETCPEVVKITDKFKYYPLHRAAQCGDWVISKYLLDLYPDALLIKSLANETPRDLANKSGHDYLSNKLCEEEKKQLGSTSPEAVSEHSLSNDTPRDLANKSVHDNVNDNICEEDTKKLDSTSPKSLSENSLSKETPLDLTNTAEHDYLSSKLLENEINELEPKSLSKKSNDTPRDLANNSDESDKICEEEKKQLDSSIPEALLEENETSQFFANNSDHDNVNANLNEKDIKQLDSTLPEALLEESSANETSQFFANNSDHNNVNANLYENDIKQLDITSPETLLEESSANETSRFFANQSGHDFVNVNL